MAQAGNKTCEICIRASGLHYCSQCDQVFCDDCKMSHLRSKISRNHTFLTRFNIKTPNKKEGCTDHNEDFIYLCEDCDQLICRLCVTKAHKKHAVVDIKDSNKAVQAEISKYLNSKISNVRLSANSIEGRKKTYKREVEATVHAIIEQGNAIKEIVDRKVDSLIKSLKERETIELQYLSKANKGCKDFLEEATRHQRIYHDMIKKCDEVALFQKMKKIKSDIDNLKTVDVTSLPSATYDRERVKLSEVEKLLGNLTCQETEIEVKNSKLSTVPHDLPQQTKQSKRRDQPARTKEILKRDQTVKDQKKKKLETLNNDLQQRLQGKTNLKKLETEGNQLTEELAKMQHQRQQDTEQYHQSCKENKDLRKGLKPAKEIIDESQKKMTDLENEVCGLKVTVEKKEHAIKALKEEKDDCLNRLETAGEIINESQKKVTDLENEVHGLEVTTEKKEHTIKALRAEKDDCLNRLSSMAGDKLTKGNPAITDLGDPNRPMKIAEKYGGLYDNEWTDAMESSNDAMRTLFPAVDHQQFDEILVYHLHRLVMCCYRECLKLSTEQEQTIRSAIINSMKLQIDEDGTDVNNMPGYREIVNLRRQNAQQFANTLFQNKMISMTTITTDWDYIYKKEELIGQLLETPFFEKCVHLCWYMVIQDPVMYMTEEIKPNTVYDRDVYKEFMQSGDKVKYVVWPALFLHEGGPLLYKGVVEAYK